MLDIDNLIKMYIEEHKTLRQIEKETGYNRKNLSKELRERGIKVKKGITDEQAYIIFDFIKNGHSLQQACKEFNVDKTTLTNKLERMNLRKKENPKRKRIEKYDKDIINMYNNNLSIKNISISLGISTNLVYNCLKRNNIQIRNEFSKYTYDKSVFKKIDTEEKAYWLGFLYADGYVNETEIELSLAEKDYEHLVKFNNFLKSNVPIKYRENIKAYRLLISCKKIAEDLTALGCFQCKSLALTFPTFEQVPEYLIHHFMRGYFDGDGCICTGQNQLRFSVIGTPMFLDEYENILLKNIGKEKKNKRGHDGLAENIHYGGNIQCYKIYTFLYRNATVYLERKHIKFIAVLSQKNYTTKDLE